MTAIFGGEETVRVRRLEECTSCTGSGVKRGAKVKSCSTCGGQGMVNNAQRTSFGTINSISTCSECRGTGEFVSEHCAPCKGKGVVPQSQEITVKIPKGVAHGAVMRVKEGGNAGKNGGARGDLFVEISVQKDPRFERQGIDILSTHEISYVDAILGTNIRAEVVDGFVDLKIPAGTQPGQKLRLRGKGAHKLGSDARGDAFVTVKVDIPTKLSRKEKELLEQLQAEQGKNN